MLAYKAFEKESSPENAGSQKPVDPIPCYLVGLYSDAGCPRSLADPLEMKKALTVDNTPRAIAEVVPRGFACEERFHRRQKVSRYEFCEGVASAHHCGDDRSLDSSCRWKDGNS